jgi:hypothetical protein
MRDSSMGRAGRRAMKLRVILLGLLSACSAACGDSEEPQEVITSTRDQLLDPQACRDCHADHFDEWSGSMHAYAAEDPVFIAMNKRGQEETGGALGDFCLNCHAPVAVREGYTAEQFDRGEVPEHLLGVTCYFCHNVAKVEGEHNAQLRLANDVTMRGGIKDPAPTGGFHGSTYSPLMDYRRAESATMCGACHDIVTESPPAPAAVHLERTFLEWKQTIFSGKDGNDLQTCSACHMDVESDTRVADFPGVGNRPERHLHNFPGVDVALTAFPLIQEQTTAITQFLDTTLAAQICLAQLPGPTFVLELVLDNIGAGHHWPSGAAQDRRAWVEVVAYESGQPIYQSGVVAADEPVTSLNDPDLWLLRDAAFGEDGQQAHMFWDVARTQNVCSDSEAGCMIPGPVTIKPWEPGAGIEHVRRRYPKAGQISGVPERVTVRVFLRPVGLDVLDDLIATGHLDPSVRAAMPTHELLPHRTGREVMLEWTPEQASPDADYFVPGVIDGVPAPCVTTVNQRAVGR